MKNEGDITKLPKWARFKIEKLERDLEFYKAKLAEGPEDSDTFADPYHEDAVRPLGKGALIEFKWGEDWSDKIQARLEGKTLKINGASRLCVFPVASNVVEIQAKLG